MGYFAVNLAGIPVPERLWQTIISHWSPGSFPGSQLLSGADTAEDGFKAAHIAAVRVTCPSGFRDRGVDEPVPVSALKFEGILIFVEYWKAGIG